ncbi:MAG TPA: Mth938-like domain-containing protein [Alphaproteobacteria bacterium]|nr:Mth938-like domain-containing protein [Alphaproteobacteria bacterium]
MDVTPLVKQGAKIVQSYGGGVFKISGQAYQGAVIVMPDQVLEWAAPSDIKDLNESHFTPLAGLELDVLLLGTGAKIAFSPPSLKTAVKALGLPGFDAMDTGAACRTYNVLLAEGRRVAALLMPVRG